MRSRAARVHRFVEDLKRILASGERVSTLRAAGKPPGTSLGVELKVGDVLVVGEGAETRVAGIVAEIVDDTTLRIGHA